MSSIKEKKIKSLERTKKIFWVINEKDLKYNEEKLEGRISLKFYQILLTVIKSVKVRA